MIQDLHSHTYYSFCGKDNPEVMIEAAIAGGIELYGICDHNHGIGFGRKDAYKAPVDVVRMDYDRNLIRYFDHMTLLQEKYADRIRILRGIELSTRMDHPKIFFPEDMDISYFDYCLIESLDWGEESTMKGDLFGFVERCKLPRAVWLAHTDLLGYLERIGEDPYRYLRQMAQAGIFWEMNVSYDSIHKYREHAYMLRFFEDKEQQAMVRESGIRLSVGFDGHRIEDYLPGRVADYCRRITDMGIKLAFEE